MEKDNELLFGVVIVTYNRLQLLKECIECVRQQERSFDRAVIVDNCSSDGTSEYLDSLNGNVAQELNIVHSEKNLGGAGGFYVGIKELYQQVDYVLVIDDDAMIDADFLKNIITNMVEGIYAYSGSIITKENIDTSHRRILKNSVFMLKSDVALSGYEQSFFDYDLSTFCGLMVSTDIIRKIGLPRKDYFIWYDDTEYSLRIRKYTKIRNINSAQINHKANSSYTTKLNWKSFYGYRNALDMGIRHSTIPFFYKWYRLTYHRYRAIEYKIKCLCAKTVETKKYYDYCYNLHMDVIQATKKKQLGICEKYKPK